MVGDAVVWYGITIAAPVLDGFLPLTEAVQRLSSVVVDLQCRLCKGKDEECILGVRKLRSGSSRVKSGGRFCQLADCKAPVR